jgi:hypothetical protein
VPFSSETCDVRIDDDDDGRDADGALTAIAGDCRDWCTGGVVASSISSHASRLEGWPSISFFLRVTPWGLAIDSAGRLSVRAKINVPSAVSTKPFATKQKRHDENKWVELPPWAKSLSSSGASRLLPTQNAWGVKKKNVPQFLVV